MKKRPEIFLVLLWFIAMAVLVAPVSAAGLTIYDGEKITTPDWFTSPRIIIDPEIAQYGTITINIAGLNKYVASGNLTIDNVYIQSDNGNWAPSLEGDILTLTTNSPTLAGDYFILNFDGYLNPWISNTSGEKIVLLTANRTDGYGDATFNFVIDITPPQSVGLSITDGATITETNGASSPVITITDPGIDQDGSIKIFVPFLTSAIKMGTSPDANIVITDTAESATWTGALSDNILTLTSTGGPTLAGENVTVTFTGAVNPWRDDLGYQPIPLTAIRNDGGGTGYFTLTFNITPPPPVNLSVDFTASPRSGIAPLSVNFTDLSKGNPSNWSWDFGDGATSTYQNPDHVYTYAGQYTVSLTVWNPDTMSQVSKGPNYINVINDAKTDADTQINGLTILNCGGPQTISVNTSILKNYTLSPDKLEIQTLPESGFKIITFYGDGFSQVGNLISGNPTGVRLVSVDLAPTTGFSDTVGKASSFSYTIDLQSYPCNAQLSTKIWEGAVPKYDSLLWRVASNNGAVPVGTAYTAEITKTNFPSDARIKLTMSIDRGWLPSTYAERVFIWRIADDEKSGQIFNTTGYSDPVNNLDYYEADSPEGLSTFGLSSFDGSNNPFQMIAFVAAQVINPGGSGSGTESSVSANAEPGSPYSEMQGGGIVVPTPVPQNKPAPLTQPAMSTNVGMVGWLLALIQDYPIILVGVVGVIAAAAYFGWWKRRL